MRARPLWIAVCGPILLRGSVAFAAHHAAHGAVSAIPAFPPSIGDPVVESAEALADGRVARPDRLDCSGFVLAAYREAGRPLAIPDRFAGRSGSEAGMLLAWARSERRLVTTLRPGDLAFFRNTYGPGDGRITHVALVEKVDPDGEVELLHVLGRGVCRSRMNVDRPGDPALNSWLRKKAGAADRLPKLAGELFVAYARFD